MSIGSAYDDILEDMECPVCGHIGMLPNGTGWCMCPECDWEGPIPGWDDEDDDDDELDDDEDDDDED